MQARLGNFSLWFTKAKFYGEFIRLNGIDRLKSQKPNTAAPMRKNTPRLLPPLPPLPPGKTFSDGPALTENVFKIRRCVWSATARSLRSLPPWATVATIIIVIAVIIIAAATPWAAAAILITPGILTSRPGDGKASATSRHQLMLPFYRHREGRFQREAANFLRYNLRNTPFVLNIACWMTIFSPAGTSSLEITCQISESISGKYVSPSIVARTRVRCTLSANGSACA